MIQPEEHSADNIHKVSPPEVTGNIEIPLPKKRLTVNLEIAEKWIADEPDEKFKEIKQKLINNLHCVSHEEFQDSLDKTVEQLNQLIGDQEYAVLWDYKPHASKRWVYELVKSKIVHPPVTETYFGTYDEMEDFEEFRKILDKGVDTFVVMDDAIYSGEQFIKSCLNKLMKVYREHGYYPPRIPKVFLVAPYMTNNFKDKDYIKGAQEQGVVTLVTDQVMPTLSEILSAEEKATLEERNLELDLDTQKKSRDQWDPNQDEVYYGATLTAFDHRVADAHSFCEPLAHTLGLYAPKPYADKNSAYFQREEQEYEKYQEPKLVKNREKRAKSVS